MTARLKDLRRLETLLTEERTALKATDFARLDKLAPRKIRLLDAIEADGPTEPTEVEATALAQVQRLARRNARLLDAAMAGLRDVQSLLEQTRKAATQTTYGRDGTREQITQPAGRLDGRA